MYECIPLVRGLVTTLVSPRVVIIEDTLVQTLESLTPVMDEVVFGGLIKESNFNPQKKMYPLSIARLSVTVIIQFPLSGQPFNCVLKF